MVTPYLSRLRPAESAPRLRPRPRSRFEPAPAFPIDGPAGASLGLSPPSPQAEPAEVEAESEPDPTDQHPAGLRIAAVTVGDQEFPLVRAQDSAPGQAAGPRPWAAVRATRPADDDQVHLHPVRPAGTAVPPAPPAPPPRPAPPAQMGAPSDGTSIRPGAAGDRADFRPARPGTDRGLAAGPAERHRPCDGRAGARSAGPGRRSRRSRRYRRAARRAARALAAPAATAALAGRAAAAPRGPDAPRGPGRPGGPARAPADRVQAMARWLRDADTAPSRGSLAGAIGRPASGAGGPGPGPARRGGAPGRDRDDRADRGQDARPGARAGAGGSRAERGAASAQPRGLPGVADEGEGAPGMSNNAAIAAVTATLTNMIQAAVAADPVVEQRHGDRSPAGPGPPGRAGQPGQPVPVPDLDRRRLAQPGSAVRPARRVRRSHRCRWCCRT